MPAEDRVQSAFIRAIEKDGWTVIRKHYPVRFDDKRLWIDLSIEKTDTLDVVLVEIKDFAAASFIEPIRDAIGQYVFYRIAMKYSHIDDIPLFLAVPKDTFVAFFDTPIGQLAIQEARISLIVYDSQLEVIERWIPYAP